MNIAELFVNLGIKGSEKTVGALTNIKKGLGETASMSLEAKAGIVAAMYALERLFAASGAMGTGLTNFNALTGLSTKQLQQWQFAARQAGVSGDEMAGTFKAVQAAMSTLLRGGGAPSGLGMVANAVGLDQKRLRDTAYVLEQLQKFAQKMPKDMGNLDLKSFGLSENVIAAMRRNAFTPDVMAKAPTYSENEIGALDRANIAWSNLGNKIQMAIGHFNAKHGGQIVKDISMMTDSVLKLAEALQKVADKFGLLETVGQGIEGIANTLKLVNEIADKISGKESKKGDLLYATPGQEAVPGFSESPLGQFFQTLMSKPKPPEPRAAKPLSFPLPNWGDEKPATQKQGAPKLLMVKPIAVPNMKNAIAPRMPAMSPAAKQAPAQNINVNQNLSFQHEGKDHKQTADSVKRATQEAFRQFPQGQVN